MDGFELYQNEWANPNISDYEFQKIKNQEKENKTVSLIRNEISKLIKNLFLSIKICTIDDNDNTYWIWLKIILKINYIN